MATFHTSNCARGRCRRPTRCCGPSLEKINGRIAVSEDARRTVTTHLGGDAVVIPNGVYVAPVRRRRAPRPSGWAPPAAPDHRLPRPDRRTAQGSAGARRGAAGGARARPRAARCSSPGRATLEAAARAARPRAWPPRREFLGMVSDEDKAALLRVGRPLRRPAHRRGELRHRARRGDERRRAGRGQRPAGVRAGARRRAGRGDVRQRGRRATWRARCCELLGRPAERRAGSARPGRERAGVFDWSVVADRRHGRLRDGHRRCRREPRRSRPPTPGGPACCAVVPGDGDD